jgi:hypothetical protein
MSDDFLADIAGTEERAKRCAGGRPQTNGSGYRSVRLECPQCGLICRTTRGALARGSLTCCGVPLEVDAPADDDTRAAGDALERLAARALRDDSSGYTSRAANCGVCGRFKSRPSDVCGFCGDEPTQYGSGRAERAGYDREYGYR